MSPKWIEKLRQRMLGNKYTLGRKLPKWHKDKLRESCLGSKNINWKGGITPEHYKIRQTIEYKTWRKKVYQKYNWACQKCKDGGKNIIAHHIYSFIGFPELRFDVNNGIVLCRKCHALFHKLYGTKYNTKEQLNEFLILNEE